jgi:putative membrane protein insertion efficiency factor
VADISEGVPPPARNQSKKNKWDDYLPDCMPDCGDCGSPSCDCDLPGCDLGLMMISWLALGRLFRFGPGRGRHRPSGPRIARPNPAGARPTVPARAGMAAIRGYQRWISPRLRTRCRHVPNCSAYGMTAVRRYGLRIGSHLTADRIRRCTAPTPHGTIDPVP